MAQPYTIGELDKLIDSPGRVHTKEALEVAGIEPVTCGERRIYMLDDDDIDRLEEALEEVVTEDDDDIDEEDED